jgi:hypothetical protein
MKCRDVVKQKQELEVADKKHHGEANYKHLKHADVFGSNVALKKLCEVMRA